MGNKRVPEIRIDGFSGEWEEKKLEEVFEQTSDYVNPKEENIELWSLTVDKGLTPKTDRYNREFLVKKDDKFKSVLPNEFIYNPMNMTLGAVDLNLTKKRVAVSGYYITMMTNKAYDSKYFGVWLKSPIAIKKYKAYATGSLIEKQRVQFPTLSQIKTLIPLEDEQIKIGNFFKQLDDTIALYQQELDTLKKTKQGFLQKMFPKEGESVPEIRFPGFTGDWEQSVLGEIGTFKNGMNFGKDAMGHGHPFVNLQDIFGRNIVDNSNLGFAESSEKQRRDYNLKKGDILFIRSSVKPEGVGETALVPKDFKDTTYSGFIIRFRPMIEMNNQFKRFIFKTRLIRNQILSRSSSSANTNINQEALEKIKIKIPLYKEQKEIGDFFQQLDDTITLHEKELETLKQTKKAFLQKMFV